MDQPTEKNLPMAIGLNILWPGAGYIYYGRVALGIVLAIFVPILAIMGSYIVLILFWVVMFIDLIIMNNKNKKEIEFATTKKCPNCAELIKAEARLCRFCGTKFTENLFPTVPALPHEPTRQIVVPQEDSKHENKGSGPSGLTITLGVILGAIIIWIIIGIIEEVIRDPKISSAPSPTLISTPAPSIDPALAQRKAIRERGPDLTKNELSAVRVYMRWMDHFSTELSLTGPNIHTATIESRKNGMTITDAIISQMGWDKFPQNRIPDHISKTIMGMRIAEDGQDQNPVLPIVIIDSSRFIQSFNAKNKTEIIFCTWTPGMPLPVAIGEYTQNGFRFLTKNEILSYERARSQIGSKWPKLPEKMPNIITSKGKVVIYTPEEFDI